MRKAGAYSVIGSGEAERDSCRHTIARAGLEKFTDEQAAWAFSGFIDAGLSLLSAPQRFDEGIGDLKLHFFVDETGWQFVPQHTEMFRGRIADRNQPLGYAPVNSVSWNKITRRFLLRDYQSGSRYPLASILSFQPYDLRGTVNTEFDPYSLRA
ncbi:hypothetical protein [Sulfitobacter sp. W002]|uniref:hypothetical protein n=1 Tax=Sulfitobacter sp. W002 TaxID=2867024 RepID=UPI0021A8F8F8|nr:hypothetical protein [Sulfitobacter sp. W002]